MKYEKEDVFDLAYLLSCAIKEVDPDYSKEFNYQNILELATKHQVYNIIISLIKNAPDISSEYKKQFRDYNLTEISKMLVVNNEREKIYSFLDEHSIKHMPLKGLVIRDYYPTQSMRQMSDNDILFDVAYRDEIGTFMKDNGYKCVATGENSDDYKKPPFSMFEFHKDLFFEGNDFCPKFDNLWANATRDADNPYLYHMGINDIYIYSVCHMYKHFSTAGCGIRFLADNYLILKKECENLDWNYINDFMGRYGISDFEQKTRSIAYKIFDAVELDEDELEMFEIIMNSGIFGSETVRLVNKINNIEADSLNQAKRIFITKRLFPPKKKMIADYRILEKRPYLLPGAYVYRFFKALFNSKRILNEVKTINKIDTDKEH